MLDIKVTELDLTTNVKEEISKLIAEAIKQGIEDTQKSLHSKNYFTKEEAAEYMNVSSRTLDSFIKQGLVTSLIGKRIYRIAKQDCDNFYTGYLV